MFVNVKYNIYKVIFYIITPVFTLELLTYKS